MIRGLDVSSMQGTVPWSALAAAGNRFVYIRCDVGNDPRDVNFDANVGGAQRAGLAIGAYHVAYPLDHIDPVGQAQLDWSRSGHLGAAPGELSPALDMEWPLREKPGQPRGSEWNRWHVTSSSIRAWSLAWLREMRRLSGRYPVLYTFPWFWGTVSEGASAPELAEFSNYPLWLASNYGKFGPAGPPDNYVPMPIAPWTRVTLNQWDGTGGAVMPNGGDADFDVFLGDEAAWADFRGLPPPASETAPDDPTQGPAA